MLALAPESKKWREDARHAVVDDAVGSAQLGRTQNSDDILVLDARLAVADVSTHPDPRAFAAEAFLLGSFADSAVQQVSVGTLVGRRGRNSPLHRLAEVLHGGRDVILDLVNLGLRLREPSLLDEVLDVVAPVAELHEPCLEADDALAGLRRERGEGVEVGTKRDLADVDFRVELDDGVAKLDDL